MADFVTHPLIKDGAIERRKYQETLLVQCLSENCLVILPTGLGKTIVAALLSVARLNDDPGRKVVFLAPTKPLAAQHQRVFREVLTLDPDALNLFTGATPPARRERLWKDTTVAFMTPQVFQNDIIARRVDLGEVALVVFDEAHRAVGDYAYTFIAEKYAGAVPDGQILGITASPGGNLEKISEVVENLRVTRVEVRTEESPDVKPYVHDTKVEWRVIQLPARFQELRKLFQEQLRHLYKYLKRQGFLKSEVPDNVTRAQLLKVQRDIQAKLSGRFANEDATGLFNSIKATSNAIRISHALELVETQGVVSLWRYLDKMVAEAGQPGASGSLKNLAGSEFVRKARAITEEMRKAGTRHPKVQELVKVVKSELARRGDSRIMVFAQFRDTVATITRELERANRGFSQTTLTGGTVATIKPVRFVGQQNRKGDKGLTQTKQVELLEKFRGGEYNVLVATSVAEEGLDVSECDLVVFYDVVPSEIRTIQRRGRTGRRKTGKVVVLIAKETRDEGYYWAARAKERKMREILSALGQQPRISVGTRGSRPGELQAGGGTSDPRATSDKAAVGEGIATGERARGSVGSSDASSGTSGGAGGGGVPELEFTFRPDKPTVLVDHRETASPVVKTLDLLGATVELHALAVGDYVVSPRVGVERKTGRDFVDSMKDGRLFAEITDLVRSFTVPILVLEGSPLEVSSMAPGAVMGAISALVTKFRVHLLQTRDAKDTARHLLALAKYSQKAKAKTVPIRFRKTSGDPSAVLEALVARVPGINIARARALLRKFGTLRALFSAGTGELQAVEGIGPKLAREIEEVATREYETKRS
ncbi:MAG: DEAD/DEAH box helicase [Promethearchaeota archaeon]